MIWRRNVLPGSRIAARSVAAKQWAELGDLREVCVCAHRRTLARSPCSAPRTLRGTMCLRISASRAIASPRRSCIFAPLPTATIADSRPYKRMIPRASLLPQADARRDQDARCQVPDRFSDGHRSEPPPATSDNLSYVMFGPPAGGTQVIAGLQAIADRIAVGVDAVRTGGTARRPAGCSAGGSAPPVSGHGQGWRPRGSGPRPGTRCRRERRRS